MIKKISASTRFHAQHKWLSTYHLFSFADYYDPANMNFGALRVFNDDTIDGNSGFGPHGHRDMEIVTIVLQGELTHKDSMGNIGTIKAGEVQYMSAGTGVTHAEMNAKNEPVHLYQIWISPDEKGLQPLYAQKDFSVIPNKNILLPIVSNTLIENTLHIRAVATIYTSVLDVDQSINHSATSDQGTFIYVTKGSLVVNGISCQVGDQLRIEGESFLTITATETTQFLLIDVAL